MTDEAIFELLEELRQHNAQLAPHIRERRGGKLLLRSMNAIELMLKDRVVRKFRAQETGA